MNLIELSIISHYKLENNNLYEKIIYFAYILYYIGL